MMKNKYHSFSLLFLVLILWTTGIQAQQAPKCLTPQKMQEQEARYPGLRDSLDAIPLGDLPESQAVIKIPVVVHVVYRTSAQNISSAQVVSQINALNRDFRKQNGDTVQIPVPFKPLSADTEIEFCLATRDPEGNPTSGIIRTQTSTAEIGLTNDYYSSSTGGSDAWPRDKYLNIWVLEIGDNTLGFAYPPGWASPGYDGVVIDYRSFGTMGTAQAPFNLGRTATHEVGHFLGLMHIWGDSFCGNDNINDTPTQESANYGCKTFPHRINSCSTTNPNGDMFMNYMDYVDDHCMVMFSQGQKTKMLGTLNSSVGQRSSLKNSLGCGPVGMEERLAEAGWNLYPNPVSDFTTLRTEYYGEGILARVIGPDGRIVRSVPVISPLTTLDLSDLSSGIYFVSFQGVSRKLVLIR